MPRYVLAFVLMLLTAGTVFAADVTVLNEAGTDMLQEADSDQTSVVIRESFDATVIQARLLITLPRAPRQ